MNIHRCPKSQGCIKRDIFLAFYSCHSCHQAFLSFYINRLPWFVYWEHWRDRFMKEAQIVGTYPQLADLNNFSLQKYEKGNDIQCEGNPTISFAILQSLVRRRVGSISWCNGNMAFPTFMTQFISFIVLLFIITPIIFTLFHPKIHLRNWYDPNFESLYQECVDHPCPNK